MTSPAPSFSMLVDVVVSRSLCTGTHVVRTLRDAATRLRALWIWRHGREHAAICGVIEC